MTVTVDDTGIGIPRDQLDTIFEAFTQLDSHDARKFGGTGLGLTITKRLVEMMGGTIAIASEVGTGSCISLALNNLKVFSLTSQEYEPRGEPGVDYTFLPARVLVVDDSESSRSLVRAYLEPMGLTVEEAESGEDGLARAAANPPDLVLVDLKMPGIGGIEAIRRLKADAVTAKTPIMVLTAFLSGQADAQAVKLGAEEVIRKPISKNSLAEHLLVWLKGERVATSIPSDAQQSPFTSLAERETQKLSDLAQALGSGLSEKWSFEHGRNNISGIISFAMELEEVGTRLGIAAIADYAARIVSLADSMEIEELKTAMALFPEIEKKIESELTRRGANRAAERKT